jgi:vitamin B12 transporter
VDAEDERLSHRPLNKVRFNLDYRPVEALKFNLDIQWVDERDEDPSFNYDQGGNPVQELDAYTLVNLSARYRLNPNLELYGRVENLFDEFYEEAWSYATPGLSAYAGIRITY